MIGSQGEGVAHEPPSDAVVRALDLPAVGLVMAFAALRSLPQVLSSLAQLLTFEGFPLDLEVLAIMLGLATFTVLQLVTGFAVAWQWSARRLLCALYVAAGLATVALLWVPMRDELGLRQVAVALVEAIGAPLLVLAAPRWFDLRRISEANALGGLLLVYGLATCIGQPIMAFGQARSLAQFHAPVGSWLGAAIPVAIGLVIGALALNAGLRMARRESARRALLAYVIVAIATSAVFHVVRSIYAFSDDVERMSTWLVTNSAISFAVAVTGALLVWSYAKRETLAPGRQVDAALPWIALWFAPHLISRCLLWDEVSAVVGSGGFVVVAVCLALGFVLILAARDSLRDPEVTAPWLVASGFSLILLLITVYFTWQSEHRYRLNADAAIAPLSLIFATTATAAWLRRRVTSAE